MRVNGEVAPTLVKGRWKHDEIVDQWLYVIGHVISKGLLTLRQIGKVDIEDFLKFYLRLVKKIINYVIFFSGFWHELDSTLQ